MAKVILFLLSCFTWQMSIASAGDFEQGIKFFEQKSYAQAKELWQPLAKKGDVRAQYNLAILFYKEMLNKSVKVDKSQNDLQRQNANKYLAMSRSKGLVDAYFITMPALDFEPGNVVNEPLAWLNQQQKSTYTLQLATGKSRKSMEEMQKKLLASQSLDQPHNLYIHTVKKSEQQKLVVRYVLVYGIFETYQEAKSGAEKLPESIQKSSPWIRQFGVIQSIVNAKQKNNKT